MNLEESVLAEFDREMSRCRRILASIPEDKMTWKAHDDMHDICWNANHIVDLIGWTPLILSEAEFDMAPVDGPAYETSSESNPSKLLELFDQNVTAARSALGAVSSSTLQEPWALKQAGQTLFTINKGECVRTWVMNHMIHHRAILSVCLRLAGVAVTPAYDE